MSRQPTGTLPATGVDNSEVVSNSSGNDRKLAKSDFTKAMRRAKKYSFLTFNARQVFTKLR